MDGTEQLVQSDKSSTGYKGVILTKGRYRANCDTAPCRHNYLGRFDTAEEGAQSYLQHWETNHPEELKQARAQQLPPPVLPEVVQEHLLIRSDQASTGYKGVAANKGRYRAQCDAPPCHNNHVGSFGTPEEAAQAYLQHQQHSHNHDSEPRYGWLRLFNALHEHEHEQQQQQQQPCVGDRVSVHWPDEGQWFSGLVFEVSEDDSSYCVVYDDGEKVWHSWEGDGAPDWRVDDGKAVKAVPLGRSAAPPLAMKKVAAASVTATASVTRHMEGSWQCSKCTLINDNGDHLACSVCNEERR